MLKHCFHRLTILSLFSVVLMCGCASRRSHTPTGRVYGTVGAEAHDYNPGTDALYDPVEPTPVAPPVPTDSDPPPPTRSTSDLPPAPPRDDFESAQNPGRHSAWFSPFAARVRMASRSTN